MATRKERFAKREAAADCLQKLGINFYTHNRGVHLIVNANGYRIDFWPGTGRWKSYNRREGFGIETLLNHINFYCKGQ